MPLQISNAMCNYNAWLSVSSQNGGLTSSNASTVVGGSFLTIVPYTVQATWGTLSVTLDTSTGNKVAKVQSSGANAGALSLNFATVASTLPVVQGLHRCRDRQGRRLPVAVWRKGRLGAGPSRSFINVSRSAFAVTQREWVFMLFFLRMFCLLLLAALCAADQARALGVTPLVVELGSGASSRTTQIVVENDNAADTRSRSRSFA